MLIHKTKATIRKVLGTTNMGYKYLLKRDYNIKGPFDRPHAPWANAVLMSEQDVERSLEQVKRLGLPKMPDLPKNWDSLAALDLILKKTGKNAKIFDAGGELYSMILLWLFLYGYKNLIAGNLVFTQTIRRGPILYENSDITHTKFSDETFDAVTCLSVIEHGVDLNLYFKEMSRIIKKGGFLITSTDYYETPIDTKNQQAYGVPIYIFCKDDIIQALNIAQSHGFTLISPLDLTSSEKVVCWKQFDLNYTFLLFSLQKTG